MNEDSYVLDVSPDSKFPTPWGFPELNVRLTKTTSRSRLTRSGTNINGQSTLQTSKKWARQVTCQRQKFLMPAWEQATEEFI